MSLGRVFAKSPLATLDYGMSWADWLGDAETIQESVWQIAPAGLTVVNETRDVNKCYIWLSGGELDTTYYVTNKITTNEGRVDARTLVITVKNR